MNVYIIGLLISLVVTLAIMPSLIKFLHQVKFGQHQRVEGPKAHFKKAGTPTMGGIVFVLIPVLLFVIYQNSVGWSMDLLIILIAYLGYALIGFLDDFIIVVKKDNKGLRPAYKFALQAILAIIFYFMYTSYAPASLYIPFVGEYINIGILFFFLIFIMFTAESNATNLTDGLDGLCASTSIIALFSFFAIAIYHQQTSIAIFIMLVIGSLIGYLFYNKYPAKIFMGDTGSLAIGGLLAALAMILKVEFALIVIGGIFLIETLSVVLQVTYFKISKGKRIFKMAPYHHHLEMCGLNEVQIVRLFSLIGIVFALIGFWIGIN